MRKAILKFSFIAVMIYALFAFTQPIEVLADDALSELGFSTSGEELENYDERKVNQPYGDNSVSMAPVLEEYTVEIRQAPGIASSIKRSLLGDNDRGDIDKENLEQGKNNKYVKATAVDLGGQGKENAVAELYYRDANNGELYLSLVDASKSLESSNEIMIFSNTNSVTPLITDYKNQHTFLNFTAGDFDNDDISELAVYIPDASNPHIALYDIENGQIKATNQVFKLPSLSEYVYMTSGDITGDNIDDLVVSHNERKHYSEGMSSASPYEYDSADTANVYIFKSQNFSLSSPHVFNQLNSGKAYYNSGIRNGAVAIGDYKIDKDSKGKTINKKELIIAGAWSTDRKQHLNITRSVIDYRYDKVKKTWDFVETYGRMDYGSAELFQVNNFSKNELTTLACVSFGGPEYGCSIYINGVIIDMLDDIYDEHGYLSYVDYGIVSGNFDGNSDQGEQLKILREKFIWDGTKGFVSQGFEIATVNSTGIVVNTKCRDLSGIQSAALAAPNTDDDTVIIRYKGYELQYSQPNVLAVLASPPYFEDLGHLDGGDSYIGNSSTEFTKGDGSSTGKSHTSSVSAGVYVTVEEEISIFGQKIVSLEDEYSFNYEHSWETQREREVVTEIAYGTFGGQDSVVLYSIPMDVYTYEVYVPAQLGKPGFWQTMQEHYPYAAAHVVVPLEQYDNIARSYNLPIVGDKILTHKLGQPETYPSSCSANDAVKNSEYMEVGFGKAYTSQSVEITDTTTKSSSYEFSGSIKTGGGGGGVKAGIVVGGGGGNGKSTSSIKNTGFTGTVVNMPLEAQNLGYGYQWKMVTYPYYDIDKKVGFPVISYLVQQTRRPPMLPDNFEAANITTDSITLRWENTDPNTMGYQVYRYYNFDGAMAGYYKIGDILPAGTTSFTDSNLLPYTSYSYKIQSIGKRYGSSPEPNVKSVMSPEVTVRTSTNGDTPVITVQPKPVTVAAGSVANFQVIVQPADTAALSERVFYTWQKYINGNWMNIDNANDATYKIIGVTKNHEGIYRCVISQQIGTQAITVYSDSVKLTVDKNSAELSLSIESNNLPVENLKLGDEIKLTASFSKIQTVKPSGYIEFHITCYPEAKIVTSSAVSQEPVKNIVSANIIDGTYSTATWCPKEYGAYDVVAVYMGDKNYSSCVSSVQSFSCADSSSSVDSSLRITGLDNNVLTYGDVVSSIGATVTNSGAVKKVNASDITFTVKEADEKGNYNISSGLNVELKNSDNPCYELRAKKPGNYSIEACYGNLRVRKAISVKKAEIAIKAIDKFKNVNAENPVFDIELIKGNMKFDDVLKDKFNVEYGCAAVNDSPSGLYDIFINKISENSTNNYIIAEKQNGILTVGRNYNIKFHGVSNGKVTALINGWDVKSENFVTGYDLGENSSVKFTAIPDKGYRIEKWVVNGNAVMKSNSSEYDTSSYISTAELVNDIVAEVYFVPDLCELNFSSDSNGQLKAVVGNISVGQGAKLPSQTVISFTAIPNEGYMVKQWSVNGVVVQGYMQNTLNHTITQNADIKVTFAPAENVLINYESSGNGTVTARIENGAEVTNKGLVNKGSNIVFNASPKDLNSMIKEWIVNGNVVQGNNTVYIAKNVQQDLNVKVVFTDAITYTVNYAAAGFAEGALTAEANGVSIKSGDRVRGYSDVTFTAHVPAGYRVKQWKKGSNVIVGSDGLPYKGESYKLEELKSSVTVTVEYESDKNYYVKYGVIDTLPDVEGGINGTITARTTSAAISVEYESETAIKEGSSLVFMAVPDVGYAVKEWIVDGKTIASNDVLHKLDSINKNYEIYVKFMNGKNPLRFGAVGNGVVTASSITGTVLDGCEVNDGTDITFKAVPHKGYKVKEWRYNGKTVSNDSEDCIITIVNGGYVEVEFEGESHTLVIGENLSILVDGAKYTGNKVQDGKEVTVVAIPPDGYILHSWYKDGILINGEQGNSISFIMTQDTDVKAEFTKQYYIVSFNTTENGTLTASADGQSISSGTAQPGASSITFTANPSAGYKVKSWFRGKTEVTGQKTEGSAQETYVIDKLKNTESITVYFEKIADIPVTKKFIVSFKAGDGGILRAIADGKEINSGDEITEGSKLLFTAVPGAGKTVDTWSGISSWALSADKITYTIEKLALNENITVSFKNTGSTDTGGGSGGGGSYIKVTETISSDGSASVKPYVGGIISLGKEASVIIPSGALQGTNAETVRITKADDTPSNPSGFMVLGQVYSFKVGEKSSYKFKSPVTLIFTFDETKVANGEIPVVCYYDESQSKWVEIGGVVTGNKITVMVDHFTLFAVMTKDSSDINNEFKDTINHWAKSKIAKLINLGVVNGYTDGTFKPDKPVTRAEFASMLVKALKLNNNSSSKYFDDTLNHWSRDNVAIAVSNGIISGCGENSFRPDAVITREEMAAMIVRTLKTTENNNEISFSDNSMISYWASDDVRAAVGLGIMNGYPDNSFKPHNGATRAEAVAVIVNLMELNK